MNNTLSTQIQALVNKLPVTLFFEEIKDRKQALKYVQWLYDNVPESKTIMPQDQLFREVISKELRLVSMKIIEIEILLMVGLETITLNDFSIDSKSLIRKLISQNHDNYDLDIMYRIMAQIMTKLPKDLKERVTGKQKLQIFQQISQSINIDNKLLEEFASVDPSLSLNTPVSMDLDEGDYDTLNKKYLFELKNYEASKGYVTAENMEYADIAKKNSSNPTSTNSNLKAQYIDSSPDFMLGQNDNTLYYFDSSSGALTEMPLNGNHKSVSLKDLKTILTSGKVKQNDIQGLINDLQTQSTNTNTTNPIVLPTPTILSSDPSITTQPKSFFDTIGSYFTSGSRFQAIGTSSPNASITIQSASNTDNNDSNDNNDNNDNDNDNDNNSTNVPIPPQYIINSVNKNKESGNMYSGTQQSAGELGSLAGLGSLASASDSRRTGSANNGPVANISRDITTYEDKFAKIDEKTKRIIERQVDRDSNSQNSTKFYYSKNNNNKLEKSFDNRDDTYQSSYNPNTSYSRSQINNLEKRFESRADTYKPFFKQYSTSKKKSFMDRTNANDILPNQPRTENFTNMNEETFLNKIKNDNKQIENVALSFVTIIILVFLLVIFNSIRNKK